MPQSSSLLELILNVGYITQQLYLAAIAEDRNNSSRNKMEIYFLHKISLQIDIQNWYGNLTLQSGPQDPSAVQFYQLYHVSILKADLRSQPLDP